MWQWSARVVFSISRREWEFLRFNLVHRDETENSWHLLSGFETRLRKNFLQSRASRRDRDLLSSLSGFETRTRIPLIWSRFSRRDREFWNLPSFPEIRLERPHYFACNFWEANYIKCRAFWNDPVMFFGQVYCDFFDCCHKCHNIECFESHILVSHLTAVRLNFEMQHFPVRQLAGPDLTMIS